jgi:hypothetical protein
MYGTTHPLCHNTSHSVLSRFHFSGGRIEIPGGPNQTSEWALHPKQPKMYSYFIFPGGRWPPLVDKSLPSHLPFQNILECRSRSVGRTGVVGANFYPIYTSTLLSGRVSQNYWTSYINCRRIVRCCFTALDSSHLSFSTVIGDAYRIRFLSEKNK